MNVSIHREYNDANAYSDVRFDNILHESNIEDINKKRYFLIKGKNIEMPL